MKALILLLCIIGGCTAFFDIKCDETAMMELQQMGYKPNATELDRLCPPALEFFRCYFKGVNDSVGMDVEQLLRMEDEFVTALLMSIYEFKNVAVEICNEHSTLRKDYLENVDCYERVLNDVAETCGEKADSDVPSFLRKHRNLKEEDRMNAAERACLGRLYVMACHSEHLDTTCGEVAVKAYQTLVGKLKYTVLGGLCRLDDDQGLKRAFLEYLNLEGKKSEFYKFALETFKKR